MNKTKCFILSTNGFIKDTEMKWPEVQLRDKRKLNFSRNGLKRGKENFPICHSGNMIILPADALSPSMGEDDKEKEVFKLKLLPWFSKVPNSPSSSFLWWVEQVLSCSEVKLCSFLSFTALTWSKGQICLFCMEVTRLFLCQINC